MIVAKVLKEVGIFMKDGAYNHLNICGVITMYGNGVVLIVIVTIVGDLTINNPILKCILTRRFGPPIHLHKTNTLTDNLSELSTC